MNGELNIQMATQDEKINFVTQYAPLVKRIAHHLVARLPASILLDDLIQTGMIGLLEAAKNFEATKGASFETYAGIRIRGHMLDEVRKSNWTPRSVHRNSRRIVEAMRNVENRIGRDARDHEIAEEMDVSISEYYQMQNDVNSTRLADFEESYMTNASLNESEQIDGNPLNGVEREKFHVVLTETIRSLPEKERLVLVMYYDAEMNLKEIGEVLGVTESRVCQIHSSALVHLKSWIHDWADH